MTFICWEHSYTSSVNCQQSLSRIDTTMLLLQRLWPSSLQGKVYEVKAFQNQSHTSTDALGQELCSPQISCIIFKICHLRSLLPFSLLVTRSFPLWSLLCPCPLRPSTPPPPIRCILSNGVTSVLFSVSQALNCFQRCLSHSATLAPVGPSC